MSRKKLLLVLGAVLALSMAPTPGRADVSVAPPFDESYGEGWCDDLSLSDCSSDASVEVTGAFAIATNLQSPGAGSLPGFGSGGAYADYYKTGTLAKAVPAIELTVQIHVDEASVERAGGSLLDGGYGYIDVYANVSSDSCYCWGGAGRTLAEDASGGLENEDLTLTFVLRDGDGGPVSPGGLYLGIGLYSYGTLGGSLIAPLPNTGTLDLTAIGSITSVTARALSA